MEIGAKHWLISLACKKKLPQNCGFPTFPGQFFMDYGNNALKNILLLH